MGSFVTALPGAVSQGLIWGIMAIGVYITYKILDIADLTVDGSFCTGGAAFVVLFSGGMNVWLALLISFAVGLLAGLVTGILHTFCGIPAILAGILTQLGLYSINLAIMGMNAMASIGINDKNVLDRLLVSLRFVTDVSNGERPFWMHPIFVVGLFTAAIIALLYWFFGTELGCSMRATGSNSHMAQAQGINTNFAKVLGLMLSNGLVALSGAFMSSFNSSAEINMGRGAIVIGLAAVIIGDVIFGKLFKNFALRLLAAVLGGVIYYIVIQLVLQMGLNANDLKLFSALVVALFLGVPYWKGQLGAKHVKTNKGGKDNA